MLLFDKKSLWSCALNILCFSVFGSRNRVEAAFVLRHKHTAHSPNDPVSSEISFCKHAMCVMYDRLNFSLEPENRKMLLKWVFLFCHPGRFVCECCQVGGGKRPSSIPDSRSRRQWNVPVLAFTAIRFQRPAITYAKIPRLNDSYLRTLQSAAICSTRSVLFIREIYVAITAGISH